MVVAAVMMRETPIYNRCLFNAAIPYPPPLLILFSFSLLIPKVSSDTLRHTYLGILIVIDLRARNRDRSSSFHSCVFRGGRVRVRLGSVEDCVSTPADFHFHHYQRLFSLYVLPSLILF